MDLLPPTVPELIKRLDEAFPHRCIRSEERPEDAHRYAGKRELVDYLIRMLQRTEEEATAEELLEF